MLGESVISISAALADIAWNQSNVIAAVSGFVMVSAIWWIYYDSFHLLEQRRITTGHSILYSHFFLFVGLAILASLIRHAILGDLDRGDFRQLAAAGTGCRAAPELSSPPCDGSFGGISTVSSGSR